jgi:hypothetical protein
MAARRLSINLHLLMLGYVSRSHSGFLIGLDQASAAVDETARRPESSTILMRNSLSRSAIQSRLRRANGKDGLLHKLETSQEASIKASQEAAGAPDRAPCANYGAHTNEMMTTAIRETLRCVEDFALSPSPAH